MLQVIHEQWLIVKVRYKLQLVALTILCIAYIVKYFNTKLARLVIPSYIVFYVIEYFLKAIFQMILLSGSEKLNIELVVLIFRMTLGR